MIRSFFRRLRFWRAHMCYLETEVGSARYHRRGPVSPETPRFLSLMARRGLRGFVARDAGPTLTGD